MAENPVLKRLQNKQANSAYESVSPSVGTDSTSNPVLRSLKGETAQNKQAAQAAIVAAKSAPVVNALAEEDDKRTFGERVKDTFSGWKDRTAASYAGAAENLLEITRALDSKNSLQSKQATQAEKNASHYREMLERGTWDNGKVITAEDRVWINEQIKDAEKDAEIYRGANTAIHEPVSNVISNVEEYGDRKQQSSEEALSRAKEGASAVGKIAVDLGTIAGDIANDAVLNRILPGLGTASRATRMYGLGAEKAEDKGYDLGTQALYGAGSAAIGEATNRLLNSNPILQKAYGKGALDDILFPGLNATKGVRIVKGGLGELGEEVIENVSDVGWQALLFGKDRDKVTAKDIGYDALLSAIIGAGTGAISPAPNKGSQDASGSLAASAKGKDAAGIKTPQEASVGAVDASTEAANPAANTKADPLAEAMFGKATQEPNAQQSEYGSVGAAAYNFQTPDSVSEEKTSRVADTSMRYNSTEQEATGLDAEQYEKLLKYKTLTEKMATQQADDMLYVEQDGQRKFIRDVDEAAYQDVVNWLKMAPAWDGPMTDTAHMIRNELKSRAANGEISHEEYVAWLESMREHATASGQGVQAHAKWSRTDNRGGATTELEAKRALEKSKLPPEEQARIFSQIVQWDSEIEAVEPGDTASLKAIIMKAANERGVVGGLFGNFFASRAESALDVLTFDQLKQFAYSSTAALANDSTPANAGQKVKAIQVLNMLSKPTTFSKNITGNTTFYGLDAVAMNGASLIDMVISKMTGTRSIAMEGLPDMRAAVKAMQMAIAEITLDIDMGSETSRYGTGSSRTFKMGGTGVLNTNTSVDKFVERIISSLERNQAYLLNATDEFYKGAARATESKTQKLIDSGKIKTSDKEYAKKQADNLAKVRTFQDNSKVSAAIQTIHDVLNLIGVGDSGKKVKGITVHSFGLGDIVAPFTKIAGNLVSRGIEYSPLNAAKGTLEIVKQVAAAGQGNVDAAKQAQGVSDLARGMTGTAIAYGFMQLVKAGLMRQADDEGDKDVAALNQSEGVHGTQLNISATERALSGESAEWRYGDTLIDLSSIEPLNLLMNLGAEMAKEQKNPLISSFGATVTSAGKAAAELPVLENVGDFVKDVAVYKRDWKEALGEMAANTAISSVVPNVVSGIAAGMDDRPRNVYTGDNLWDYIQDSFKNKIPGLRETLPTSTNSLGEEKTYQGSQDSLLASLLSPVGINTYAQGSVSAEMERVREATGGDVSFYPESTIPKKLSFDNKEVALTYDQRQKYQNVRGNTQTRVTDAMMKTQAYKKASAEDQAALLNRCKSYAQQTAKASILGEKSVDKWVLNAKSAERDLKMSTVDYISLYEKYGHEYLSGKAYEKTKQVAQAGFDVEEYIKARTGMDADDNDRLSKKEARNRLREVGYTEKEIPILMEIINKTW